MTLRVDYSDDVYEGNRKYNMVTNGDNTVSLIDVTTYSEQGDDFGAEDINATNEQVNTNTANITSTEISLTLNWADWEGDLITINNELITASSNQEILPARNIGLDQLETLQNANLQDYAQGTGYITLKAFGDIPTMNIPIRIIFRGVK